MSTETEAKPTGADLLRRVAEEIRKDIANGTLKPDRTEFALLNMLDAAAEAFPIDHTQPPRNPLDRALVLAVLEFAGAGWDEMQHGAEEDDTDA